MGEKNTSVYDLSNLSRVFSQNSYRQERHALSWDAYYHERHGECIFVCGFTLDTAKPSVRPLSLHVLYKQIEFKLIWKRGQTRLCDRRHASDRWFGSDNQSTWLFGCSWIFGCLKLRNDKPSISPCHSIPTDTGITWGCTGPRETQSLGRNAARLLILKSSVWLGWGPILRIYRPWGGRLGKARVLIARSCHPWRPNHVRSVKKAV